jgi:uncharacterized membrane protein YGL010W
MTQTMKSLTEQLAQYAQYHRDQRNVWTHFAGIPIIVVSLATLFSRGALMSLPLAPLGVTGHWDLTVATLVSTLMSLFYLRLDMRYGVVMAALLLLACVTGQSLAAGSFEQWITVGMGLFVIGWVLQFVGHYFEGRKPAFVDDAIGFAVGPLFVVAELGFLLGLRRDVHDAVVSRVGGLR